MFSVLEEKRAITLVPVRLRSGRKPLKSASTLHSNRSKSRLLEPHPRVTSIRHEHIDEFFKNIAAMQKEEDPWQDIQETHYENGRLRYKQKRFVRLQQQLEGSHTWKQQEDRVLREGLGITAEHQDVRHEVATRRRLTQHRVNKHSPSRAQLHQARRMARLEAQLRAQMAETERLASDSKANEQRLQEILSLLKAQQQPRASEAPSTFSKVVSRVSDLQARLVEALTSLHQIMMAASDKAPMTPKPAGLQVLGFQAMGAFAIGLCWPYLHYAAVTTSAAEFAGFFIQTASLPMLLSMHPTVAKTCHRLKKRGILKGFFSSKKHRRSLSSSTTRQGVRKEVAFRDLVDNHSHLLDKPFPMAAVLNDLRNLQALRGTSAGREYKIAERRLFRVQHESESGEGTPLTVRQVTELLQPDDSVGWTAIL